MADSPLTSLLTPDLGSSVVLVITHLLAFGVGMISPIVVIYLTWIQPWGK